MATAGTSYAPNNLVQLDLRFCALSFSKKSRHSVKLLPLAVSVCQSHQQNVKTTPGPPRGVMVPLVLLVHLDPP